MNFKVFAWVISHFAVLEDIVRIVVTGVEQINQYVKMSSADKKQNALDLLTANAETLLKDFGVTLPEWVKGKFESVLGFLIDLVVRALNLVHGHDWIAKVAKPTINDAVPAPAHAAATPVDQAADDAKAKTEDAKALAQAQSDFKAIEEKNAAKKNYPPGFTPHKAQ